MSHTSPVYTHIVVGAGTAGCLLANRLSADAANRVLLIEAGGNDDYLWVHIPVGYLYCIGNPRTDWLYFTEPDAGLNGRKLRYPRGKVLGMVPMASTAPATAPAVNGGSKSNACPGRSSTRFRPPRKRPVSLPPTTSTAAATKAWAIST